MALRIKLLFSVRPEQLFDAWTTPELAEQWLFKNNTNNCVIDPTWELVFNENEGEKFSVRFGEFVQVERPHRLIFTLHASTHLQSESRVSVQFKPTVVGTEMHFLHVGVKNEAVEESWNTTFQKLTMVLLNEEETRVGLFSGSSSDDTCGRSERH